MLNIERSWFLLIAVFYALCEDIWEKAIKNGMKQNQLFIL